MADAANHQDGVQQGEPIEDASNPSVVATSSAQRSAPSKRVKNARNKTGASKRFGQILKNPKMPGISAFVLPVLILFLAFQSVEVFPLGDRHILTIDLYHQYAPFLAEYRRTIVSLGSMLFSWNAGLGIDFYSLFAYYLSSPLNLLIVLFPPSQLSNFVLFLVVLKTGLAGFTSYIYLRRGRAHTPWIAVLFAMGYALSSFTLAYFWNIMWLDVVIMLPVLAYTALLLVRDERIAPYVIALAATLYVNYYVAFFAALFIALYFLVLLVEHVPFNKWKDGLAKMVLFAGASVLGAAISAALIYPVYLKLQSTSASDDAWPAELKFSFSPLDLTARMMYTAEPAVRDGLPNLYAGVLVLLFIPIYFLSRKISLRAKLAHAALLAVLALSFSVNSLNFFWHGMHYPNQLNHRFAFVAVFVLVVMAADAFRAYRGETGSLVIKAALGVGLLALVLNRVDRELVSGRTMFLTIVMLAIYAGIVAYYSRSKVRVSVMDIQLISVSEGEAGEVSIAKPKRKRNVLSRMKAEQALALTLLVVVSVELFASSSLGLRDVRDGQVFGKIDGYAAGDFPDQMREAASQMKADNPDSNPRAELADNVTYNDGFLYGYNGVNLFSSTFTQEPLQLLQNVGFSSNGLNSFTYNGTKPLDSFFGVKYVFMRDKRWEQPRDYSTYYDKSSLLVYENPDVLPQAFFVNQSAGKWVSEEIGYLDNQSKMYEVAFGVGNLFADVTPEFSSESATVDVRGENEFGREVNVTGGSDEGAVFDVSVTAAQEGQHYLAFKQGASEIENVSVVSRTAPDQTYTATTRKTGVVDLGYLQVGEEARAQIKTKQGKGGTVHVQAGRLNDAQFDSAIAAAKQTPVQIQDRGRRSLSMNVNAPADGYVLVSTIWDPGWNATVNGTDVEVEKFSDSLMLVPVQAGQNAISMKFRPQGFIAGMVVSVVAVGLLAALIVFERRTTPKRGGANGNLGHSRSGL
ncbi:MAG: YfhO family protein [Actinomycetaceae bacterium]|nr:YfhO family protein [Actinomycetaceae bacterium]